MEKVKAQLDFIIQTLQALLESYGPNAPLTDPADLPADGQKPLGVVLVEFLRELRKLALFAFPPGIGGADGEQQIVGTCLTQLPGTKRSCEVIFDDVLRILKHWKVEESLKRLLADPDIEIANYTFTLGKDAISPSAATAHHEQFQNSMSLLNEAAADLETLCLRIETQLSNLIEQRQVFVRRIALPFTNTRKSFVHSNQMETKNLYRNVSDSEQYRAMNLLVYAFRYCAACVEAEHIWHAVPADKITPVTVLSRWFQLQTMFLHDSWQADDSNLFYVVNNVSYCRLCRDPMPDTKIETWKTHMICHLNIQFCPEPRCKVLFPYQSPIKDVREHYVAKHPQVNLHRRAKGSSLEPYMELLGLDLATYGSKSLLSAMQLCFIRAGFINYLTKHNSAMFPRLHGSDQTAFNELLLRITPVSPGSPNPPFTTCGSGYMAHSTSYETDLLDDLSVDSSDDDAAASGHQLDFLHEIAERDQADMDLTYVPGTTHYHVKQAISVMADLSRINNLVCPSQTSAAARSTSETTAISSSSSSSSTYASSSSSSSSSSSFSASSLQSFSPLLSPGPPTIPKQSPADSSRIPGRTHNHNHPLSARQECAAEAEPTSDNRINVCIFELSGTKRECSEEEPPDLPRKRRSFSSAMFLGP